MEGKAPFVVVHVGVDSDADPILALIGDELCAALDADDGATARVWMDRLHHVQETRAIAAVAAAWN